MGEGLIRAVAGTVKRSSHVVLEKQANHLQVVVRCSRCKMLMTLELPAPISALTKFLKKCEKDHKDCAEP